VTVLALYSNKGGVGKTAAAVNLAYLAAQTGAQILICDLDPQSSTTYYFRVKPKLKPKARGFVKAGQPIDRSIKGTDYEKLDLLPADFSHRNLDLSFAESKKSKTRLKRVIGPLKQEYEYIILDCPPTINIVAENVFNTADFILVPLIPTTLSVRTHRQLLSFLQKNGYEASSVYGFISMLDRRKKLHRQLALDVQQEFDRVLRSPIPYLSAVEQMGLHREPLPAFAPNSAAAKAYQALWAEIQQEVLNEQ
jgi:cellulose biosynthesis protein BcsQ